MRRQIRFAFLFFAVLPTVLRGEEARYVVENGVTYRETRGIERRPIADTHLEDRTQTVYKTEFVTEVREETRVVWVPITEYTYAPRWTNRWNVFAEPTVSYEYRPVTRWEPRTETVRVPLTVQKVIPETKIVQTPVRTLGFADREYVERVVVNSPPSPGPANPTGIARQPVNQPVSKGGLSRPGAMPANTGTVRR